MRFTGAILTGGFLLAVAVAVLGEFARGVEDLRARLKEARVEMRQLAAESRAGSERLARDLLRTRADFEALRERLETRDVERLYRDVLAPSVQVNASGGVGGGTLLFSRPGQTYAITAYHVVQKAIRRDEAGERRLPVDVRVYDERGRPADLVPADIVASDERRDLALLRLRTDRTFPYVARLASRESLRAVKVFTPVYAVGCPLGHDPLPTLGEVATLAKEVNGENFWMMNAPTIFGNSGGGIFHRETRELLGVSVMVCTYDGVVSTPVPHLGILVSLETVYDWLDALQYRFVYDPDATIEACESARSAPPPWAPSPGARPTGFPDPAADRNP
ncbi:MAG: trypsin-like peptidase domain-containing protein [Planctomycetota bacterium]